MKDGMIPAEHQRCIDDCQKCAALCTTCGTHCLHMGGDHAGPEHQALMQDCADICATAARFMERSSEHAASLCGVCADVCLACAESCDRLAEGDEMMKRCAEACRTCASSCQRMAGAEV